MDNKTKEYNEKINEKMRSTDDYYKRKYKDAAAQCTAALEMAKSESVRLRVYAACKLEYGSIESERTQRLSTLNRMKK